MSKLIFETKRKLFHIAALIYLLAYWIIQNLYSKKIAILFLLSILIFLIIIEYFRVVRKEKIPIFHILFREQEENSIGGQVYYFIGMILALSLFDFQIALAAILMMTLGDAAAAIFGIAFGKHWIKSIKETAWEGIAAEFIVDIIIAYFIIGNWYIMIPMALTATLVETIFPHVDDNLTIPIFAGFIAQTITLLL